MSYDDAIAALSNDALKLVRDNFVIGLGSGRAATALVMSLANLIKIKKYSITGVPTSLQIKQIAERERIPIIEADQIESIDIVFDGADQISDEGFVIKGGGGALLRENILFSLAKKVVVMADKTKFVKNLTWPVPVEIHPLARRSIIKKITDIGGKPKLRLLDRGYPFFTENGNIILDCDFGIINNPKILTQKIKMMPGVVESGIFLRKPDIIYQANSSGKFKII